jgi:hypothetical protein
MLKRAFDAQVPAACVTGDSVYGDDRRLRVWLEERAQAYVLAVSGKEYVWRGWQQYQVKTLLATLPPDGWTRLSAGAGTKLDFVHLSQFASQWIGNETPCSLQPKGWPCSLCRSPLAVPLASLHQSFLDLCGNTSKYSSPGRVELPCGQ